MYLICATPYVHAFQVHSLCLRSVNGSIAISWPDEQMGILDFVRESLGLQREEYFMGNPIQSRSHLEYDLHPGPVPLDVHGVSVVDAGGGHALLGALAQMGGALLQQGADRLLDLQCPIQQLITQGR